MRLYASKIPTIAEEIIRDLAAVDAIEVESEPEARLDIEAVLREYLRAEREISDEAKSRMEARGLGYGSLGKAKAQVARERGLPSAEEALPYMLDQILNMLLHSANISEVFFEDMELRKRIAPILRRHLDADADLDVEVRAKIKNLEEGTATFEIEYARVMDQIRRKKGLV